MAAVAYRRHLPLAILLLAFALRLYMLGDSNYNWDEAWSNWIVQLPYGAMIETTASDVHPPLYYQLLRVTHAVLGDGEFALRFPSALLGLLTVALTYGLARAVGGRTVGLLAMLLMAVSRVNIDNAQIARMYVLATLFASGALWATAVFLRDDRRKIAAVAYVIFSAAALHSFYLSVVLPLATNATFAYVWLRRGRPRSLLVRWTVLQLAAALLFLPWAVYALGLLHGGWTSDSQMGFADFLRFYAMTLTMGLPAFWEDYFPLALAALGVVGVGIVFILLGLTPHAKAVWLDKDKRTKGAVIHHKPFGPFSELGALVAGGFNAGRRGRTQPFAAGLGAPLHGEGEQNAVKAPPYDVGWGWGWGETRDSLVLLVAACFTPALVAFVLTLPAHDLARPLAGRYLPLLSAAFYTLAAWGIVAMGRWRRPFGAIGAVIVVGVALFGLSSAYEGRIRRDDFISLGETLRAQRRPEDAVILNGDRLWPHVYASYTGERIDFPFREELDDAYADSLLAPIWERSDAVWLIQTPESVISDPTHAADTWLAARAVASRAWTFGENTLALYVRTAARARTMDDLAPGYDPPGGAPSNDLGLLGLYVPLRRYATGDSLNLALYWKQPPQDSVTLELAGNGQRFTFSADAPPAASTGPTRQSISLPLTSDIPAGDYTLSLAGNAPVQLARISIANSLSATVSNGEDMQHRLDWRIGDSIELLGYTLSSTDLRPGDTVQVDLYWRTPAPLTERYKVLVYILGEFNPASGNPLWGQQDSEPFNWTLPTTQWPVDTVLKDSYTFTLSAGALPGEYRLGVVMYHLVGGERLLVYDAHGALLGDTGILTTVRVS